MSCLLQFFTYEHLSPALREASRPFCELATKLAGMSEDERRGGDWEGGFLAVRELREALELPDNDQSERCARKMHEVEDGCVERYGLDDVMQLLLEAKDCAVRAVLFKPEPEAPPAAAPESA